MAKSKSGGTRSYIRGRVGADVYSIGKDAKGAKQQVVRSLAETVSNPQTVAQMGGRMIMSTIMQAVSAFKNIIDHSFDNVPKGQPCISEFISRQYALMKADSIAHPASGNDFGYNAYHVKGVVAGKYLISAGDAVLPSAVQRSVGGMTIHTGKTAPTVGDLKTLLGLGEGDFLTLVRLTGAELTAMTVEFVRLKIDPSVADSTALSSSNINTVFVKDGQGDLTLAFMDQENDATISWTDMEAAGYEAGAIISKKTDAGYQHSTCQLGGSSPSDIAWDDVIGTYPVGTEMFLNGGDL